MCSGDPRNACLYTCIFEIVLGFIGFCVSCSAIKFQDRFNELIDGHSDYGNTLVDINAASVGAFFFFLAMVTGGFGVHGHRHRNRWAYLLHIAFAGFITLVFFALFIHSIVQFKLMHTHVDELDSHFQSQSAKNATEGIRIYTEAEQKEFNKDSRIDMNEVKDRLMFPVILYLFNIVIYLSSASFAWKSWKMLIDGHSGMTPFENEDDKPASNPIE